MDKEAIKLECIKLSHTGSPDISIKVAKMYYDWIVGDDEKPKRRGRPPKNDD